MKIVVAVICPLEADAKGLGGKIYSTFTEIACAGQGATQAPQLLQASNAMIGNAALRNCGENRIACVSHASAQVWQTTPCFARQLSLIAARYAHARVLAPACRAIG